MKLSRRKFLKGTVAIAVSTVLPTTVIAEPVVKNETYRYTRRVGLPKCAWRKLNEGLPVTKSTLITLRKYE